MKPCTRCKEVKPLSEFYHHIKHGPRPECKACIKIRSAEIWKRKGKELDRRNRAWRAANPEKVSANVRKYALKGKYGLEVETYNKMLADQNDCCAVCMKHKSKNVVDKRKGKLRELAVDHDHSTGKIRSLLCDACNRALGLLRDDLTIIDSLRSYLIKHKG